MKRKTFLRLAAAALAAGASAGALAQAFPSRTITLVSPTPPGSPPDVLTRALAQQLSTLVGQPVVVENKPGANMQLAAQAVANARPDGHTVLISGNAAFTVNQHLLKTLTYDPVKSFEPVTTISKGAWLWAVNPQTVSARTIPELIQMAKEKPEKITYADSSPITRVLAEIIQQKAGIKFYRVPYRTGTQALPDLLGGRLDMVFIDTSVMKHVAEGNVRVLGWTDTKRLAQLPQIPTLEESGLPGAAVTYWLGANTPAGTPAAINERLAALLAKASEAPGVQRAHQLGGTYPYLVPLKKMAELQASESQEWGRLIKAAGIEQQ
ncbi:MAG TPA: tripartite tricarboxylate transporter substrate binding protein [Ramlibacter sp.]|nr:tripartite tricarboxylate transporter substrate binding protein [Ramlibacter sp.]